jgi:redox-sensitive bicupin YhaK (pirin superfamily)
VSIGWSAVETEVRLAQAWHGSGSHRHHPLAGSSGSRAVCGGTGFRLHWDKAKILDNQRRLGEAVRAMITLRPAGDRGRTDWGWLDSRHTFSFGEYFDPDHMGFGSLRVINDDRVAPGGGFGTHGHRDMEILSYVLEGALEHRDSMGTGSVIRPGEIQFMRAGSGVTHSEMNHSKTEPVHFLQIWVVPAEEGLEPAYDQRPVDRERAHEGWVTLASGAPDADAIRLAQDVGLRMTLLSPGRSKTLELEPGRHAWIHVARGSTSLQGSSLQGGDGLAVTGEAGLAFEGGDAELLVFDLP